MISATCRTSKIAYRDIEWPSMFLTLPRIGEYVETQSGHRLKVIEITHKETRGTEMSKRGVCLIHSKIIIWLD